MIKTIILSLAVCTALPVMAEQEQFHAQVDAKSDPETGALDRSTVTKSVNAEGTAYNSEERARIKVDKDGERVSTVEASDVTDPKGLMNKSWSDRKSTIVNKSDGEVTHMRVSKEKDAKGTYYEKSVDEQTKPTKEGALRTTRDKREVTDPKGLMNKHVNEEQTTVTRKANGVTETSREVKRDGQIISKETVEN